MGPGNRRGQCWNPASHRHRFLVRCQNCPGPPAVGVDDQGEGLLTVDVDLERTGGRGGSGIDETARPGTQSGGIPGRVHLGGNGADARLLLPQSRRGHGPPGPQGGMCGSGAPGLRGTPLGRWILFRSFPRLIAQLDLTRIYLPSSPMSFTKYTSPNKDKDRTVHIWDVWNNKDCRAYRDYKPRFADGFGFQAPPAWSTLTREVHDSPLDPFSARMLVHQKAVDGTIKLSRGMRFHPTPGDFYDISYGGVVNGHRSDGPHSWLIPGDRWEDIENWHWACQLQQAQAIRFGVEYMRSLEPVNAGTLVWPAQ